MQTLRPSNPNPDLTPTACLVPEYGPRLLLAGAVKALAGECWGHCTRCGARDVALPNGLHWQRMGQPRRAQYMVCAACFKKFKKSGAVQERFFKRLDAEAPIFSPNLDERLPKIEGNYRAPDFKYLYLF